MERRLPTAINQLPECKCAPGRCESYGWQQPSIHTNARSVASKKSEIPKPRKHSSKSVTGKSLLTNSKHTLRSKGHEYSNQDVYGRILGPTPDETILAGLQTVIDMCCPEDTRPAKRSYSQPRYEEDLSSVSYKSGGDTLSVISIDEVKLRKQTSQSSQVSGITQVSQMTQISEVSKDMKSPKAIQATSSNDIKVPQTSASNATTEDELKTKVLPCFIENYFPSTSTRSTSPAHSGIFKSQNQKSQSVQTSVTLCNTQSAYIVTQESPTPTKKMYAKSIQTLKSACIQTTSPSQSSRSIQTCCSKCHKLKNATVNCTSISADTQCSDLASPICLSDSQSVLSTDSLYSRESSSFESTDFSSSIYDSQPSRSSIPSLTSKNTAKSSKYSRSTKSRPGRSTYTSKSRSRKSLQQTTSKQTESVVYTMSHLQANESLTGNRNKSSDGAVVQPKQSFMSLDVNTEAPRTIMTTDRGTDTLKPESEEDIRQSKEALPAREESSTNDTSSQETNNSESDPLQQQSVQKYVDLTYNKEKESYNSNLINQSNQNRVSIPNQPDDQPDDQPVIRQNKPTSVLEVIEEGMEEAHPSQERADQKALFDERYNKQFELTKPVKELSEETRTIEDSNQINKKTSLKTCFPFKRHNAAVDPSSTKSSTASVSKWYNAGPQIPNKLSKCRCETPIVVRSKEIQAHEGSSDIRSSYSSNNNFESIVELTDKTPTTGLSIHETPTLDNFGEKSKYISMESIIEELSEEIPTRDRPEQDNKSVSHKPVSNKPCGVRCLRGDRILHTGESSGVRYAIARITKFSTFSTFEILKSQFKPQKIPTTTESIFVLRNKPK